MERRVLLAIFLCFLVLYAWQALFVKPTPKQAAAAKAATAAGAATAGASAGAAGPTATGTLPSTTPSNADAAPTSTALIGETAERDIRIETPTLTAVFTNRGARLRSWQLKR